MGWRKSVSGRVTIQKDRCPHHWKRWTPWKVWTHRGTNALTWCWKASYWPGSIHWWHGQPARCGELCMLRKDVFLLLDLGCFISGELFAAFVLTNISHGRILDVDASRALCMPGVVEFVTHKDVRGINLVGMIESDEELFVSNEVSTDSILLGVWWDWIHLLVCHWAIIISFICWDCAMAGSASGSGDCLLDR